MAKRRHGGSEEMLLVPFLDILCSLIGVLILIIVVMVVSQAQQTNGRTQEEVQRAIEGRSILKILDELSKVEEQNKKKLVQVQEVSLQLQEKEEKAARLRKLLSSSAEVQANNQALSQNLVKELDNLLLEIDGHKKQQEELKKEIALLQAELKSRKAPDVPEKPPVIVQPGGSGSADKNAKLYFVEASGGKIVIFWDQDRQTQVGSAAETIVADASYQAFLTGLKDNPNAKIVFLIREDGQASYNNAAGWAIETYKIPVSRIGRLPIPGTGKIDLKEFKTLLGTMEPPKGATLLPPPGQAPAKAPAAPPKAATPTAPKKA